MKSISFFNAILLSVFCAALIPARAETATNLNDAIELVRAIYQTDRQAFIGEKLGLTESEGAKFWPLYKSYRADVDKLGDELVKLVLEYGDAYPDVSEDRAAKLLKKYLKLEDELGDTRAKYFKRAGKIIPASKVMRWSQLESRLDLALRLQLASCIPVVGDK